MTDGTLRLSNPLDDREFRNSTIVIRSLLSSRSSNQKGALQVRESSRIVQDILRKITPMKTVSATLCRTFVSLNWARAYSLLLFLQLHLRNSNLVFARACGLICERPSDGCPVISLVILTSHAGRSSHFFDRISTSRCLCCS